MKDVVFLWISYAITLAAIFLLYSGFVQRLTHPQERTIVATLTTVLLLTAASALLLLPALDVALVASTNIPLLGVRKEAATDSKVDAIVLWIKIAYIGISALATFLTVFAVPFSWVYFEEWDEESTISDRARTALKYTLILISTLLIVFALGLVIPSASLKERPTIDFDYLKSLLSSSRPVKALLFLLSILTAVGTVTMIYYAASGLGVLPISLLKTKSALDLDTEQGDAQVDLDLNHQKQRQIEVRYEGTRATMTPADRRALDSLHRRERALIRALRLKSEGRWRLAEKLARPVHIFMGLVLLVVGILVMETIASSLIRQLISSNSCGPSCGFLSTLPRSILEPINLALTDMPYFGSFIVHVLLLLFLLLVTHTGMQSLGIRFLWIPLYKIQPRTTVPQALLSAAAMMALTVLALTYTISNFIAPGFVQYGGQTFCNATLSACAQDRGLVVQCTLVSDEKNTGCTRSVVSRIMASAQANYPLLGTVLFYAQFATLAMFLVSLVTTIFKRNMGSGQDGDEDEDADVSETSRLL